MTHSPRSRLMRSLRITLLVSLLAAGLGLPRIASAASVGFDQGSLIIPMQRAYQTDCGAVAAYGLIYRLLQHGIPVYWSVNPDKSSHYRCQNKPSTVANFKVDGCDFDISRAAGFPVRVLNASRPLGGYNPASIASYFGTLTTYNTASGTSYSSPTPNNLGEGVQTVDSNFQKIRYMGAPFIIDASNASAALALLFDDPDFSLFRGSVGTPGDQPGQCHGVNIHRAGINFSAPIVRVIGQVPPPIALVDGGKVDILGGYLYNAGLAFPGAGGCYTNNGGGKSGCPADIQPKGGTGTFHLTPITNSFTGGAIFDVLSDNEDFRAGAQYGGVTFDRGLLDRRVDTLNPSANPDPALTPDAPYYYKVMWAPHWVGKNEGLITTDGLPDFPSTLANISHFADRGGGLFAECASIETYENSINPKKLSKSVQNAFPQVPHFQGLLGSTVTLSGNTYEGFSTNGVGDPFAPDGQDCTDPGANGKCFEFDNYANPFIQKGDYPTDITGGHVHNYHPVARANGVTTGGYAPGVLRFMTSYDPNSTALTGWDVMTFRFKDNNKKKGPIMYLAGHSYNTVAGGNRIVLDTLLNLGYRPKAQEFARSEAVYDAAYTGVTIANEPQRGNYDVLMGTIAYRKPDAIHTEWERLDLNQPEGFWFPYQEGHFRSTPLTAIATTTRQDFDIGATWDAADLIPPPASRNIYTVLGNNQSGLVRLPFTLAEADISSCQNDNTLLVGTGTVDTACDLTEALFRKPGLIVGLDEDNDGTLDTTNSAMDLFKSTTGETTNTAAASHFGKHLVQRIRGYCWSHLAGTFIPSATADCDNTDLGEVGSHLGGVDHAAGAVVWESLQISSEYDGSGGLPDLRYRPVMAYVGGLDGQLHAIFLRRATDISTGSSHNFGAWTAPAAGKEIWSFLPKGQLSRLRTNDAKVDISPVVADVYVDYDWQKAQNPAFGKGVLKPLMRHTGKYSWRTILISGSGRWATGGFAGGEIFALDVTDPTSPIVLWDLAAFSDNVDDAAPSKNTVIKWVEGSGAVPNYVDPPTGNTAVAGIAKTGVYNYADLGASTNVTIVAMQGNNRPYYQAIFSSNSGVGSSGQLNVFGVDVGTGEKNWQWQRNYEPDSANTVPASVTNLDVDGDGYIDRSYVGDMEGAMWELNSGDGSNLNYFTSNQKSYPLFRTPTKDSAPNNGITRTLHPISTAPGVMRVPYDPTKVAASSLLGDIQTRVGNLGGKIAMVFGTAGRDWVLGEDSTVQGRLYVVPFLTEESRLRARLTSEQAAPIGSTLDGVMDANGTIVWSPITARASNFLQLDPGERIEGNPTVVGMDVYVSTSFGSTESSIFANSSGNTRKISLGATGATANTIVNTVGKSAAGPVKVGNTLVTASTTGIQAEKLTGTTSKIRRSPVRLRSFIELSRRMPW